jgi:hypothetical protein
MPENEPLRPNSFPPAVDTQASESSCRKGANGVTGQRSRIAVFSLESRLDRLTEKFLALPSFLCTMMAGLFGMG